jgi:hypothetical protein
VKIKHLLSVFILAFLVACGSQNSSTTQTATFSPPPVQDSSGVVSFTGPKGNYTITTISNGVVVKDNIGGDGTNAYLNATSLKFTDMTVNLTMGYTSATIEPENLKSIIELYVAFFNRVPDADGLSYWVGEFNAGRSIIDIGNSFYAAAVTLPEITGYSAKMSDADFVRIIYKNVLGRSSVDTDGLNYWTNALASKQETRGSLVNTILKAAHTFKGDPTYGYVADLLDNKIEVASKFAVDQGLGYTTNEASIKNGMAIAAAVTPTSTAEANRVIDKALVTAPVFSFVGEYTGSYTGDDKGQFSAKIGNDGNITGTGKSTLENIDFSISGKIAPGGGVTMQIGVGNTSYGATFKGEINLVTGAMTGTWTNLQFAESGTFAGQLNKPQSTLSGVVAISPVANSTITVYSVINGQKGTPIASATSDSTGAYRVSLGTYSGLVLLEAIGGNYTDPASGVRLTLGVPLRSVATVAQGNTVAIISPVTELITKNTERASTGITQSSFMAAAGVVTNKLGTDPTVTIPADLTKGIQSDATRAGVTHAALIGTMSQYSTDNPNKPVPIVIEDFAAIFRDLSNINPMVISAENNYIANARNVLGLSSNFAPGSLATCTYSLMCSTQTQLPLCQRPKPSNITCLDPSRVLQNGVCVIPNKVPVDTSVKSLTKTWVGPWDWTGPTALYGCPVEDGGVLTARITQTGNTFSGTLTTDGTPGIKSANSSCKITETRLSSTGSLQGKINGDIVEFSMSINGNTTVLKFNGTGTLSNGVFSGKFVRSTGGNGSFNLH